MKKKIQTADITPDVLEGWKKEYGKVLKVEVANESVKYDPLMVPEDDDSEIQDGLVGFIRTPTDKELSFAMSKLPSVLEAGKVIVKNCWLGGDDEILNDTKALTSAAMQCVELIEVRRSRLKEV